MITQNKTTLVVIGASTGGPKAIQTILEAMPRDINAAFLIAQHMPPGFTGSLAERLDDICNIRVKEAQFGDKLAKGTAYIAPGGYHLRIEKKNGELYISLDISTEGRGYTPSIDTMMHSVAEVGEDIPIIGVILTGMGADGANGMKELKRNGAFTIAQDEGTSVVYGMPKMAIQLGVVDKVMAIHDIPGEIIKLVVGRNGR